MTAEQLVERSARNRRFGVEFLGEVRSCPFGKVDVAGFEQAKHDGFVVARRAHWGLPYIWERYCGQERQPYIHVELRRRYADVDLDISTTGRRLLSPAEQEAICDALHRLACSGWMCGTDGAYATVPIDAAKPLARRFREIITKPSAL